MNLEQALLKSYKSEMILYLDAHPEDFAAAINLAISDKMPHSWRAANLIYSCMKDNDLRIQAHLKTMIQRLPFVSESQQREFLRIMLKMKFDEEAEGLIFDACIDIWKEVKKKPGLRHNAMKVLVSITKKYPELKSEIKYFTTPEYLESLSPGIRRSVHKMIIDQ